MVSRKMGTRTVMAGLITFAMITQWIEPVFAESEPDNGKRVSDGNGYIEFVFNTNPVNPVDPLEPEEDVTPVPPDGNTLQPGGPGPLSIDFTSILHFGKGVISSADEVYYAEPQTVITTDGTEQKRPNYVQVTDNRGSRSGWVFTVTQVDQFISGNSSELKGAQIRITEMTVNSKMDDGAPQTLNNVQLTPGHTAVIMSAAAGTGAGTWVDYFGPVANIDVNGSESLKNVGVSLFVPGSTPKESAVYSATLVWALADTPD